MREAKPSPGVTNSQARVHIKVGRWLSLIVCCAQHSDLPAPLLGAHQVCSASQFEVFAFRASLRLAPSCLRSVQQTDRVGIALGARLLVWPDLSWDGQLSEFIGLYLVYCSFNQRAGRLNAANVVG